MTSAPVDREHRHLPIVTDSELRTFRRCMREHYLRYILGYSGIGSAETLRFGSLFHVGLEAWWRAFGHTDSPLEAAIDAITPHAEDEYDLVRAGVLLQGYDARWCDQPLEVLAVEAQFRAPLINPQTGAASRTREVAGKLDAIVRREGRIWIVEHKTSGEDVSTGSRYWQRLLLNSQVSMYYAGARSLGHDVAGCIYDVIGKPRQAPYKATPEESRKYTKQGHLYANQRAEDETPDEYRLRLLELIAANPERYYQRADVVRLEQEERDTAFDTWQTVRAMRDAELAGRYPRNPDTCERYGRMCDFFDVCTGNASLEDPTRFVHLDNVHQELAIDAA